MYFVKQYTSGILMSSKNISVNMRRICRFIKALWRYILYGKRVEYFEFVNRLSVCAACGFADRENWKCRICGCYLIKKAKMNTECCPKKKW